LAEVVEVEVEGSGCEMGARGEGVDFDLDFELVLDFLGFLVEVGGGREEGAGTRGVESTIMGEDCSICERGLTSDQYAKDCL